MVLMVIITASPQKLFSLLMNQKPKRFKKANQTQLFEYFHERKPKSIGIELD
jgi:hypothetical protein